jgi:hypothetical protein
MYEVIPLREVDLPAIRSFLLRVFGLPESHPPFLAETLRWKAFAPHPFWTGSRSYGVMHQGQLIAHGVLLPLHFLAPAGELTVNVIIDWAADPKLRGGGVAVYQELAKLTVLQIGIGGSDAARTTLPRMRFRVHQNVGLYERRERAVKHHLTAAPLDWKMPLRLGRDVWRNLQRGDQPSMSSLSARRIVSFAAQPGVPMPHSEGGICSARTPAFLDYMLQCPIAIMEAYVIENAGKLAGYCVLSRVRNSCRIADLWIEDNHWDAATALAVRLARHDSGTTSILAAGSLPFLRAALEQQGFRLTDDMPLFLRGSPPPIGPIHVSLLDNDIFYLP